MEKQTFEDWIKNTWTIAGGLLRKADAAKIMDITTARVNQMVKEQKIKEYRHGKKVFVSYQEIMKIVQEKQKV